MVTKKKTPTTGRGASRRAAEAAAASKAADAKALEEAPLLARLSLTRPIFVTSIVLATLFIGLLSYLKLGVDLFPEIEIPVVTVVVPYRGAGPAEIESLVVRPLEEELATLGGVKRVFSNSNDGYGNITCQFYSDTDMKNAEQQVRNRVANVRGRLPREIDEPTILRISLSDLPVLEIGLEAELPPAELYDLAKEELKNRFEQIPGVGKVDLFGGTKREIQVLLDRGVMKEKGVSAGLVTSRIGENSSNVPVGKVTKDGKDLSFRTLGEYRSLQQIGNAVVSFYDRPVRVSDLGEVRDSLEEPKSLAYVNGRSSIIFKVYKQTGTNTLQVVEGAKKQLAKINAELKDRKGAPKLSPLRDGGLWIRQNVDDVKETIAIGILLVIVVVYFFLGNFRSTFITGLALPNSLMGAFILMSLAGFTINLMTLLALSLSVGLLIDDAIVVRENIFRHIERGESPWRAALMGTKEVNLAVIATSAVVIAVFLPVGFLSGTVGTFLGQFGLTMCFAMAISLFDAITIAPMLSAYFAGKAEHEKGHVGFSWGGLLVGALGTGAVGFVVGHGRPGPILGAFVMGGILGGLAPRYVQPFERLQERLEEWYRGVVAWVVGKDYRPADEQARIALTAAFIARASRWALGIGIGVALLGLVVSRSTGEAYPRALLALPAFGLLALLFSTVLGRWFSARLRVFLLAKVVALGALATLGAAATAWFKGSSGAAGFLVLGSLGGLVLRNRHRISRWLFEELYKARFATLAMAALIFFGSFAAAAKVTKTFIPGSDSSEFGAWLELPEGSSLEKTAAVAREADELIRSHKEIEVTALTVEANKASFYIGLRPGKERKLTMQDLKTLVRDELNQKFPDARPTVGDNDVAGGNEKPFTLVLKGDDLKVLSDYAAKLVPQLKGVPGLLDLDSSYREGKPEYQVKLDPAKAGRLGVSTVTAGQELRILTDGAVAGKLREGGKEYDIRVRLREDQRDLEKGYEYTWVPNLNFNLVRLSSVATSSRAVGPSSISRRDRSRSVVITGNLGPGAGLGNVLEGGKKVLAANPPPAGVSWDYVGQAEDFEDLQRNMGIAILLAVVIMYLVLASLYESFITPFTIMLALPLAIAGAFYALAFVEIISQAKVLFWLNKMHLFHVTRLDASINLFSMIGLVMLLGLVAKNSILLVDLTLQHIREGMDRQKALIESGKARLRPILMTSLALFFGTLPLAIALNEAGRFRSSMGIAIAGGLVSSTLLTLVVVPAAFEYIDDLRQWVEGLVKRMGVK